MNFYTLTGDTKFLARIPEALDWLDSVRLPPELVKNNRTHPTFIELGTNKPLFVHRRGSNVVNGEYYVDGNPQNTVVHYSSTRVVDVPKLRQRYEQLKATPPEEVARNSPLRATTPVELPRFFTLQPIEVSDLNVSSGAPRGADVPPEQVAEMIAGLNAEGYWPTELKAMSNPYRGDGPTTPAPGDYLADPGRRRDRHLALHHRQAADRHLDRHLHREHERPHRLRGAAGHVTCLDAPSRNQRPAMARSMAGQNQGRHG